MNTGIEGPLLGMVLFWPLLLLLAAIRTSWRPRVIQLLPSAALPALVLSLLSTSTADYNLAWLMLGTSLGMDEISRVFLLFTSLLWIAGSRLVDDKSRPAYPFWFLLTMTGCFAVLLARDIPTFFLGYAVMSLASYGLIFDPQRSDTRRVANIYLVSVMIGEMVLLSALIMVAQNAGNLDIEHVVDRSPQDLLMTLLLIGFGIKSGVPLLHLALPPVYTALPTSAAVPLAGGLLHLGLYGWLRFLPHEYSAALTGWGQIFLAVGSLAILYGSLVGLLQKNPRALLAYSSISQMGIMTLLVGMLLIEAKLREEIMIGILLFALHHALAKGALFFGLETSGRQRWGLWLPALSLAGVPWTSGALAKGAAKSFAVNLPQEWTTAISWLIPLGSIGTTLLMARFLYLCTSSSQQPPAQSTLTMWWLLLPVAMLLPWIWPLPLSIDINPVSSLWPFLAGATTASIVFLLRHRLPPITSIPPGDVLILLEKLVTPWFSIHRHHGHPPRELDQIMHPDTRPGPLAIAEQILGRWPLAISALMLITLVMYSLL